MNLEQITQYYIPLVVIASLIVGYIIKTSLDIIPNKYIPLILAVFGAVVSCIANTGITLEHIVYGALSGLASTGLHQAFTEMLQGK